MASLDDIWDAPAQSVSLPKPPPSENLFLDSDSDTGAPSNARYASRPGPSMPDIDALFDDLDGPESAFQPLAPSLDVAALQRQAGAKLPPLTPHQVLPSSSPPRDLADEERGEKGQKGDKKKSGVGVRKPRRVLDEGRLLGPQGFPALVKQTKGFKPKGKGHELSDLNRLLTVYHFWAHDMYPHTRFHDTAQRVEKLCHSKRMHVALSVWRDEAKGLINGTKIPDADGSDADSDSTDNDKPTQAALDVPIATENERSRSRSSRGPSIPPTSASEAEADGDDFDIDAMIAEDEAARAAPTTATTHTSTGADGDEDADMWDAVMGDLPAAPYVPPSREPPAGEDEDMWDIVREMEMEAEAEAAPPSDGLVGVDRLRPASNDEGWDEMYA